MSLVVVDGGDAHLRAKSAHWNGDRCLVLWDDDRETERLTKLSGIKWRNNALRHSYGSYRMAEIQNMPDMTPLMQRVPMNRMGEPVDVANTALFLASEEGRYYTGSILHPDGGITMQESSVLMICKIAAVSAAIFIMIASTRTFVLAQNGAGPTATRTPMTMPTIPHIRLQPLPGYGPAPLTVGFMTSSSDVEGAQHGGDHVGLLLGERGCRKRQRHHAGDKRHYVRPLHRLIPVPIGALLGSLCSRMSFAGL